MAGRCWLEASLDRSSKLGLEVLQRAKRRSESRKNVGSSHRDDSCTEKHTELALRWTGTLSRVYPRLVPDASWDRLQVPHDPEEGISG
ncbi:hypothetical protein AMELA_G00039070 [Ameiurus melas]|uniref:Uncharacterized protein n=1 Tax=Ameiurus melas TaxID=219545 RepID=A0A7J6B9K5_AMEME|nr:hypothetical protein AMELA_G00039070 [Ameiurus melas]